MGSSTWQVFQKIFIICIKVNGPLRTSFISSHIGIGHMVMQLMFGHIIITPMRLNCFSMVNPSEVERNREMIYMFHGGFLLNRVHFMQYHEAMVKWFWKDK